MIDDDSIPVDFKFSSSSVNQVSTTCLFLLFDFCVHDYRW